MYFFFLIFHSAEILDAQDSRCHCSVETIAVI